VSVCMDVCMWTPMPCCQWMTHSLTVSLLDHVHPGLHQGVHLLVVMVAEIPYHVCISTTCLTGA
jgi:hypothetical protein